MKDKEQRYRKQIRAIALILIIAGTALMVANNVWFHSISVGVPAFRVISVEAEYGQLIVEVQHFADGAHWFFEHYTFQGREAFKFRSLNGGDVPHLDQASILRTIQSIHGQRLKTGWTHGRQRLTTTPLDFTERDRNGALLLVHRFEPMAGRSFKIIDHILTRFTGPVARADMTIGPESGTVSVFYPDPQVTSASVDGAIWQNPDGRSYEVSNAADDAEHDETSHVVNAAGATRCCVLVSTAKESWWRYNSVAIPNAATITSAKFVFKSRNIDQGSNSKLQGSDEDDSPIVADDTGWHNRVLTTAATDWDIAIGSTGPLGTRNESPSSIAIVQEIVDRSGWVSGNDMAFYWNNDSDPGVSEQTIFNSFDSDGVAAGTPTLQVEWTPASPGTTWATIRGGAGNNFDDWNETATTQIVAATTTDQWQNIGKSLFTFDTSALPDADNIDTATFAFVATAVTDSLTPAQSISMVTSAPASDTALAAGDFDSLGTVLQAPELTLASLTADSSTFNTFTLNSTGEGNISRTGITKFGTRISGDTSNTEPTWASGAASTVVMVTAEETLSGDKRPVLTVTHDNRASGGTTPLSGTRTSAAINLSAITDLAYCAIGWEAIIPPGTTVAVATSVDGGTTFTASVNGSCPADLTIGASLATITDFRTRVTLSTVDDAVTPLMTALGLIVEDQSGQDVYYQLITTPSATLTDRSGSGNTGTMSFPVAPAGVSATTDPIESTRTQLTFERAITTPAVVSAVSGSATSANLFGDDTGFEGLPFQGLMEAISTAGTGLPLRFVWFIFLGLAILGAGAAVLLLTKSMVLSSLAMAAVMGLAGAIGDGLMPLWMIFVYTPMAAILIMIRPGKLVT